MEELIKFKCMPVNERYYNEDSTFGVFIFYTNDNIPKYDDVPEVPFKDNFVGNKMSTLAGSMQQLYIGSEYEVTATLEFNKKYKSYQYKPKTIIPLAPKTESQQIAFLNSIINKNQAETLVKLYPNIVNDIINGCDNVDLFKTKGIKEKTYERIKQSVLDNYVIADVLTLLQPLGIQFGTIRRLLNDEPNPLLLKQKLIEDPYIMTKVKGFGFTTVDGLALKINPDLKLSEKRVYAFIKYFLNEMANSDGHTIIKLDNLRNAVIDNIYDCVDIYDEIIKKEKEDSKVLAFNNGDYVGLVHTRNLEYMILNYINKLNNESLLKVSEENIKNGIEKAEKEQGFLLTDEQKQCVIDALNNNVCIVTGPAGSGKSSISRALLEIYNDAKYMIACCAFSAKAAQRIIEATGFSASTIHRLLGAKGIEVFEYNVVNPLQYDVVLIDECSMMNANIYLNIVSAIKPGAKLIMCGDPSQLPPIGCANIFNDLIERNLVHTEKLTKVLRQAEKSGILSDANMIRNGMMPIQKPELKIVTGELKDMIYMFRDDRDQMRNIAIKNYLKAVESDGIDEVVIVVPRKEKCVNSTMEINGIINDVITDTKSRTIEHGRRKFRVGSKVIQTENNYDKNVFNGEVGIITGINDYDGSTEIVVRYQLDLDIKYISYEIKELNQIDFAYALTCHRVQGSGYKTVISIIDMTHYTLLDSCMLYTMITRAKKRHMLIAEPKAFKICIDNNNAKFRMTWLSLLENEEEDDGWS